MPKTATAEPDLKAEFAELKKIGRDERRAYAEHQKHLQKRRRFVHRLFHKKGASPTAMAAHLDISRQAVMKDVKAVDAEAAKKAAPVAKPVRRRKVSA